MQRGERRRHFPDDPGDDGRVESFLELAGRQFRDPLSRDVGRNQRQVVLIEVYDGSYRLKRWMTNGRGTFDPFPHRVIKARGDGELAPETQQLQRHGVGVVEHQQPIAKSIASSWSVPT